MKPYHYQILRYTHDRITGEFVNVGLVLWEPETGWFGGHFLKKFGRITHFFANAEIDGHQLIRSMKNMESQLKILQDEGHKAHDLRALLQHILVDDDSALHFGPLHTALTPDTSPEFLVSTLNRLYHRLVEHYEKEQEQSRDDSYAWREVYKRYFDQYGITEKLHAEKVRTKNLEVSFDKTWTNGRLHCYKPASFDLKNKDDIEKKALQLSGWLKELATTPDPLDIYVLGLFPPNLPTSAANLLNDLFQVQPNSQLRAYLVRQNEAPAFAAKLADEIRATEELHPV